jgi:AraC-like DNA-binding protein
MNIHIPAADRLRSRLLARLKGFEAPTVSGVHNHAHNLFSYCALERERLAAIKLPHPLIGIVLRGRKEVWLGDAGLSFGPGSVIILPRNIPMDVVNIPGEAGVYESLILEVPALPEGVPPLTLAERRAREAASPTFSVALTEDLVEALSHAATTIRAEAMSDKVKILRLKEVLTLLRPLPGARALFTAPLGDEVAWLIASAPSEAWTVERVAKAIGLGASTLRRRLTDEGRPFRVILRQERLRAVQAALAAGASSLGAAEAAGYVSRSHFARRYRESFGMSPSGRKVMPP